ncbi:MAG: 4-hydroxy-tetrahydrodipicolinate synthase [Nanoarchaeota archaeon]|nr:4-hydroxy-tetrahydrodipicolinate synthase [Nanoarchaeota archaeon]
MREKLFGCYVAIVTPFQKQGDRVNHPINYDSLDRFVNHIILEGVDGVVVSGCTGVDSLLSPDKQVELVKYVKSKFGHLTKVIAGDGANSTREAIELAQRMEEEAEVYTHLSISPYKNKPSDRGIIEHFTTIADNIEGKLILYSVPSRTGGKGIHPDVAEKLAEHKKIYAIKEASRDLERIRETIHKTKDKKFSVLSGDDNLTYQIIEAGGTGVISVAGNIVPRWISSLTKLALDKSYDDASSLQLKLNSLYQALFPKAVLNKNPSPNPVMCYYALNKMGFEVGIPRLPLTEGEPYEQERMDKVLLDLGLS